MFNSGYVPAFRHLPDCCSSIIGHQLRCNRVMKYFSWGVKLILTQLGIFWDSFSQRYFLLSKMKAYGTVNCCLRLPRRRCRVKMVRFKCEKLRADKVQRSEYTQGEEKTSLALGESGECTNAGLTSLRFLCRREELPRGLKPVVTGAYTPRKTHICVEGLVSQI